MPFNLSFSLLKFYRYLNCHVLLLHFYSRSTPNLSPQHTPTPSSPSCPMMKLKKRYSTEKSPKLDKSRGHILPTKTLTMNGDIETASNNTPKPRSSTNHGFIKRSGSVSSSGSSISPDIVDRVLDKRLTPSPPSSAKSSSSSRSSSASVNRFRSIVASCRDESVS